MKYGDGTFTTFGVYLDTEENTGVYPTLVKADNPLPVELSSISVSGHTTSFIEGDSFKFGGTVTATYTDGSKKDVTEYASVTEPSMADGATVTVSYTEGEVTKTFEYTISVKAAGSVVESVTESISFATTDQRISQDSNSQVWKSEGVTFTNNKSNSTTAVGNYSNPVRLYQGSEVIVSANGNISEIIIESQGDTKYKTALETSLTNAGYTYSNSGNNYTITLSPSVDQVSFSLAAQARFKKLTVTYEN